MKPIHQILAELAGDATQLLDDSRARRFLIDRLLPVYSDPVTLGAALGGPSDWAPVRELAAIALEAADREGNQYAQRTFLFALRKLAPLASSQREKTVARLNALAQPF